MALIAGGCGGAPSVSDKAPTTATPVCVFFALPVESAAGGRRCFAGVAGTLQALEALHSGDCLRAVVTY